MDEDWETHTGYKPQRHDKWSVLVRLSNYALNVSRATALLFDQTTEALIEHQLQLDIDRGFKEISDGYPSIGPGSVQQED